MATEKSRMMLSMPVELKEQLEVIAKADNRSVTNLIVTVLQKYIKEVAEKNTSE